MEDGSPGHFQESRSPGSPGVWGSPGHFPFFLFLRGRQWTNGSGDPLPETLPLVGGDPLISIAGAKLC